jgi:hypothetical protein
VGPSTTWRLVFDLSSWVTDEFRQRLNTSIIEFRPTLNAVSSASWNDSRVPISVSPASAGTYIVGGVFTTCPADGSYGSCASSAAPVTVQVPVNIALAGTGSHPIADLISPLPFSVHTGTNELRLEWVESLGAEPPSGYVIALARPGQTDEKLIYRARTMSGDAGYPCDTGTHICSVQLRFPLAVPGGWTLPVDGKYSVSVTTVFADGHRSDGRCDTGTPAGTKTSCSAVMTHGPGFTHAEFLMRRAYWPLRFEDTETFDRRPDNGVLSHDVVLANAASGAVEYIVWNLGGPTDSYLCLNGRVAQLDGQGSFDCLGQASDLTQSFLIHGVFAGSEARGALERPTHYLVIETSGTPGDVVPAQRIGPVPLPTNAPQLRPFHGFRI